MLAAKLPHQALGRHVRAGGGWEKTGRLELGGARVDQEEDKAWERGGDSGRV